MVFYRFDDNGYLSGVDIFDAAPTGQNWTEIKPPTIKDGEFAVFDGVEWGISTQNISQLENKKEQLITDLDLLSGAHRESMVSDGFGISEEYRIAYDNAKLWEGTGYSDLAPVSISCWAESSGMTEIDAAKDIISKRDQYFSALVAIRKIRLIAKSKILKATDIDQAQTEYDSAIFQLGELM